MCTTPSHQLRQIIDSPIKTEQTKLKERKEMRGKKEQAKKSKEKAKNGMHK